MQALRTTMLVTALIFVAALATAQSSGSDSETDSTVINLPFPFGGEDQFNPIEAPAGFDFAWPENFTYNIVLDEETGLYSIQQLVGDTIQYRPSTFPLAMFFLDIKNFKVIMFYIQWVGTLLACLLKMLQS